MRGYSVSAKTKVGRKWLEQTYSRPGRKDRLVSHTFKVSDDPLTFKVLFKNRLIQAQMSRMPEEIIRAAYLALEKHSKTSMPFVKKQVEVVAID